MAAGLARGGGGSGVTKLWARMRGEAQGERRRRTDVGGGWRRWVGMTPCGLREGVDPAPSLVA